MNTKPRIVLASLLAPLAVLLLPAIMALLTLASSYFGFQSSDPSDDAPLRSAGIIIFVLVPLAYPILFSIMCTLGYGLNYFDKLSRKNLFIICATASIPIAIKLGWSSPYGIKDQLIGLMVFFPITILCLFWGVYCWWYFANLGYKTK